ncbi:hypothetical protein SBC1_26380 [Caballeronia sp. SBC1]|nr:hypothetical protein SBC1_26380 [Caballeronia sp. SBC1]
MGDSGPALELVADAGTIRVTFGSELLERMRSRPRVG